MKTNEEQKDVNNNILQKEKDAEEKLKETKEQDEKLMKEFLQILKDSNGEKMRIEQLSAAFVAQNEKGGECLSLDKIKSFISKHREIFEIVKGDVQLKVPISKSASSSPQLGNNLKNQNNFPLHFNEESKSFAKVLFGRQMSKSHSYESIPRENLESQKDFRSLAGKDRTLEYRNSQPLSSKWNQTQSSTNPSINCLAEKLIVLQNSFKDTLQCMMDHFTEQIRQEVDKVLLTSESQKALNRNIGEGIIFHVEKKWGIIDLGNHDHVFFDMSILLGNVEDLRNHFQLGERLGFEALKAQKSSRANWKAISVWKVKKSLSGSASVTPSLHPSPSQDKLIQKMSSSPEASPMMTNWRKKGAHPFSGLVKSEESPSFSSCLNGTKSSAFNSFSNLKKINNFYTGNNYYNSGFLTGPWNPKLTSGEKEFRLSPTYFLNPNFLKKSELASFDLKKSTESPNSNEKKEENYKQEKETKKEEIVKDKEKP